ncbi:transposable element Tc1 transposase [Trichonephila clavata]|uniref:Transposable element Tc1 transposase n=1 Tax=Trichonephila clavata TaxID=2740835 RepID=A0A8X6HLQ2_TRICU|nr:transposable element Tc1 transposase [Trichonephila clavata]
MNREKNIDIQFNKIYEKSERLFKVDQEIKEIINFSDEEYDTMESYRDRFTEIRLTDFYDRLGSYLRALETLGVTTSNYAAMFYPVVETCLPVEVLKAWDGYRLNREVKEEDPVLTKEKEKFAVSSASHRSYIEKSLAAELNLSPSVKEILSQGLFGGGISPAAEHGRFTVTVESLDGKHSTSVSLLDQLKICSTLPRIRDENLLAELASRGIKLTDVGRDAPPIRILLGADVLGSILTGRIEILTSGVSAVKTLFGWTILGLGKKKQVVNMVTLTLQNMELSKT